MVFRRPVDICRPPGPSRDRRVGGHVLTGGGSGQDPQNGRAVGQRRYHFLDRGQYDVQTRERLGEIAVAFVRNNDRTPRLGDQEIRAGEAGIRLQKPPSQHGARLGDEIGGRVTRERLRLVLVVVLPEEFDDLRHRLVDGRSNDVARHLLGELDDVFAEIGFDHLYVMFLQEAVEADFLGHHGLALAQHPHAAGGQQLQHDLASVCRGFRPVHHPALFLAARLEVLQMQVQLTEGARLRIHCRVARILELGEPLHCIGAASLESFPQ